MKKYMLRSSNNYSSTFASWETLFDGSGVSGSEISYGCRVIQDRHLLRKSEGGSGTGLHVLDLVDRGSLRPDRSLYNHLLKMCTRSGKLREGRIVHAHVSSSEFGSDIVVGNTVVNMYAKCGSLAEARKVFDEMPVKDSVTWTVLITGYSQSYRAEDALVLFPLMLRQGLEPNQFTLSSLIKAAAAVAGDETGNGNGRQIHAYCLKSGYDSDAYVGSSLVHMYARLGGTAKARSVFDGLTSRNEASWNALIAAHARRAEADPALELYREMQREGFRATGFTYSSLCTALAAAGCLEQGKWVHAQAIKSGGQGLVGNTLLDMYAKWGCVGDAKKVFDRLARRRDVGSWNSMLSAYARRGLGDEAVEKFEEMVRIGIRPNGMTFLCLVKACCRAGLGDEGRRYFESMRRYNGAHRGP